MVFGCVAVLDGPDVVLADVDHGVVALFFAEGCEDVDWVVVHD